MVCMDPALMQLMQVGFYALSTSCARLHASSGVDGRVSIQYASEMPLAQG